MEDKPKHPPVTQDQLDIWLGDPTTHKFLHCLDMGVEDRIDYLGTGDWITDDPNNNQGILLTNIGERRGLTIALHPIALFEACDMIETEATEDGA